jgi:hypothetical protein
MSFITCDRDPPTQGEYLLIVNDKGSPFGRSVYRKDVDTQEWWCSENRHSVINDEHPLSELMGLVVIAKESGRKWMHTIGVKNIDDKGSGLIATTDIVRIHPELINNQEYIAAVLKIFRNREELDK